MLYKPQKQRTQKKIVFIFFLGVILGLFGYGVYAFELQRPYVFTSKVEAELQEQNETLSTSTLRVPILIYHSIQPSKSSDTLMEQRFDVSPSMLDQQLSYLHTHGYTTISLKTLAEDLKTGTTSPIAKPVVLTFDDGWQDQYTQAFQLLKKYHDIATFYIYTNPIGKDSRFLTWSELQEMSAAGMTIGSHTLSHPYLLQIPQDQRYKEIFDSKKIIEQHLGISVSDFASPFGNSNSTIEELLKEAGYSTGRTGYRGSYHTKNDLLHLSAYYAPTNLNDFIWVVSYSP